MEHCLMVNYRLREVVNFISPSRISVFDDKIILDFVGYNKFSNKKKKHIKNILENYIGNRKNKFYYVATEQHIIFEL